MTDIFREVEEDVRRERYAQLWKQYGDYIIAGAALLIIAAAGLQLWRFREHQQTTKASITYVAAQQLLDEHQAAAAGSVFSKLAETAPGGYAQIALLEKANSLYAAGNVPEAVEIYKQVAAKGDALLAPVARIRAAWASVDSASRADIQALLKPLLEQTSPWHPMAQEILAYADYKSGATAKALAEFRAVAADSSAPSAARQRSRAMATYLAAGGDSNFGTVPPPRPMPNAPAQGAPQQ